MANVTSAIDKSIDITDNDLFRWLTLDIISEIKLFPDIVLTTFFYYLAYMEIKVSLVAIEGYICQHSF